MIVMNWNLKIGNLQIQGRHKYVVLNNIAEHLVILYFELGFFRDFKFNINRWDPSCLSTKNIRNILIHARIYFSYILRNQKFVDGI